MRSRAKGLTGALTLAALLLSGGVAQAQGPVLEDGKTKAVYDYTNAVRERVFIPQPGIDQDGLNGDDFVTVDILRPAEGSATNKMPAIIDPSPYYTTVCRGAEGQCMADWDDDGTNDRWPLFYDNYFVPRGYAYILSQGNGTGYTEHGCPMHGGPGDIAGHKSVVDWLNGRVKAYAQTPKAVAGDTTTPDLTKEVVASWHNGSSAMIGKSYDGTLSNGVAATGVDGLKAIVPVSAISDWYLYSRTGGVRHNTNYPGGSLNPTVTTEGNPNNPPGVNLPRRLQQGNPATGPCADENALLNNDANSDGGDGDAHGDYNKFWNDRDHVKDASKVKAAVLATHGFQDDNVKMDQLGAWWEALKANNVPRKLWLLRAGHEDPFESQRANWVTTLHRWFDRYLYGVNNGIENEPKVHIEDKIDQWGDYAEWPVPGTQNVDLFLRAEGNLAGAGSLASVTGGSADSLSFSAANQSEANLMNNPTGQQTNRRVFMSKPLTRDVRISGTPTADLMAQFGTACNVTNVAASGGFPAQSFRNCPGLSVVIAEYSATRDAAGALIPFTETSKSSDGVTLGTTAHCWGVGAPGNACEGKALGEACTSPTGAAAQVENACYLDPVKATTSVTSWRVTHGTLDVENRDSKFFQQAALTPVTITDKYRLRFPTMSIEHTFKAGSQIAVIVGGYNTSRVSNSGRPNNVPVTLDTRASKVTLPIAGGNAALDQAAALPDPTAPVNGTVPATLSLSVGPAATFAPFVPGVGQTYEASTTANVISSAGDALLSVADPSSQNTGHLVNGTFALPQPLQARARNAANTGTAYNNVGSSASPLNLLMYSGPISNDTVTLGFSQRINQTDALRTGAYSKTLTFTLSTTQP